MELAVVVMMCAAAFIIGMMHWLALVRPEVLASLWDDTTLTDEAWDDETANTLRWLRWSLGALVFIVGFLTGLVLVFLVTTG